MMSYSTTSSTSSKGDTENEIQIEKDIILFFNSCLFFFINYNNQYLYLFYIYNCKFIINFFPK